MCKTMYHSSNESVKFIMKHCMNAGRELLNIRDDVMKVSDMNVDDVQDIIDYVTAN